MDARELIEYARENECQFVDVKFLDFVGLWQHVSFPLQRLNERLFADGQIFDGSSIRGWQPGHAADMLIVPDPATARLDPFPKAKTLSLLGDVFDPRTRAPSDRDPRRIARRAEERLLASGVADAALIGADVEFFIFDDVRFDQTRNSAFYYVDSDEGRWNTGRDEGPNLGYKPRYREGFFPSPPIDSLVDLRQEMAAELLKLGVRVDLEHHEVATGGQGEIDLAATPLLEQADNLQWLKYVLKNVALRNGKTLTFMPKPLFEDNASALHTRIALWKGGQNLFAGDAYEGLSETALWFVGGLLRHAPALAAFCAPTTNSYRRLAGGFDAPVNLSYSNHDRSAVVRVPAALPDPASRAVEFRLPDPSCSGYLAFAALLQAGLDGIRRRLDPGEPLDRDAASLSPEELDRIPTVPVGLEEALNALEDDADFLLEGGVFTGDAIDAWVEHKMEFEVDSQRQRPTPWEFSQYFDC